MTEEVLTDTEKMVWAVSFVRAFERTCRENTTDNLHAFRDPLVHAVKLAAASVLTLRNAGGTVEKAFGRDSKEFGMWAAVVSPNAVGEQGE